jgi:hypothetical protein
MLTGVHIEKIVTGTGGDLGDEVVTPTLADVDDGFDHVVILPHLRVRR